jgi:hypothetical protein
MGADGGRAWRTFADGADGGEGELGGELAHADGGALSLR